MEAATTTSLVHKVRRVVLLQDGAGPTDGQLLDFFIDHRDGDAFAALIRRHGSMVWGVCRRLLDRQDAEDAFQATFLVLVRKAASIVPRELVGNWLYGVARQTALHARRTSSRRKVREKQVADMPEPAVPEDSVWRELRPLLDRELSRLPDQYRSVIVLCDLEGNTRKEAARQLGVPEGSVSGWLARGRAMLAKRLTRQGITLSVGAMAIVLGRASASLPASVVSLAIGAGKFGADGGAATAGLVSVKVAALTEGVLKAMIMRKFKMMTSVLLAVIFLGGVAAFLPPASGQQPTEKKNGTPKPAGVEQPRKETDQAKIQGRWEVVSIAGEGKAFYKADKPTELKDIDMDDVMIKGDELQPTKADKMNSCWHGNFTLDDTRSPKQITIQDEGPHGKLIFRGIYSLDGDTLTLCLNTDGTDFCRPEEFRTKKGSPVFIVTFKRAAGKN